MQLWWNCVDVREGTEEAVFLLWSAVVTQDRPMGDKQEPITSDGDGLLGIDDAKKKKQTRKEPHSALLCI